MTLRDQLLSLVDHDGSARIVLRDWEWYLGRELQANDFGERKMLIYLDALTSELSSEQLLAVEMILRSIWEMGFESRLIPVPPPDNSTSSHMLSD